MFDVNPAVSVVEQKVRGRDGQQTVLLLRQQHTDTVILPDPSNLPNANFTPEMEVALKGPRYLWKVRCGF